MTLAAFGWNNHWQAKFAAVASDRLLPGRVIGEHRTHFQVATDVAELTATMTTRLRNAATERSDLAGVGDFVALSIEGSDGHSTIEAVLPRATAMIRKASSEQRPQLIAANVDVVFVVTALDGDLNLPRLERYLALIAESGAAPVIVVNKVDLATDLTGTLAQIAAIAPGVPVHAISARDADGLDVLKPYFDEHRTVALIGSSGVGKSTLTNRLLGHERQATQDVRASDNRGRHTTTHRQLFLRPDGGSLMDTPGMRGLELWNPAEPSTDNFDDIEALAAHCKFRDCKHASEPACAVRAAVASGALDAAHFARYAKQHGGR
jgi:ribosome biogenesis GTPase / thiamine phosphate phosphatase